MTTTATRRAVTLTEVLIAIFLMGIGLMAILSLFPLGASQMAQALKDQRCAEAATNAATLGRVIWKIACDDDVNSGASKFFTTGANPPYPRVGLYPFANQQFVMALDDPSYNQVGLPVADYNSNAGGLLKDPYLPSGTTDYLSAMPTVPRTGPGATGASYPVFVDPIGWQANGVSTVNKWWLPDPTMNNQYPAKTITTNASTDPIRKWRIPRRTLYVRPPPGSTATGWVTLNALGTQPLLKQFSLMDDVSFNYNGTPDLDGNPSIAESATAASTKSVERQGRYTWSYMFRRRNNADRTAVNITVVVYSGRSIDVPSPETAYRGSGLAGTKALLLDYAAPGPPKPAVRRGQWVFDATLWDANGALAPQGYFYRVVNVDDSTPGTLAVELQTPLLGGPFDPNKPLRSIIVMENVVEVFTRADVTNVAPPMPY